MIQHLKVLSKGLPQQPRALVVVSAHWEARSPFLGWLGTLSICLLLTGADNGVVRLPILLCGHCTRERHMQALAPDETTVLPTQTDKPTVTCGRRPELVFDYAIKFPQPEAYQVALCVPVLFQA
jgi:hypothetical protein